MDTLSFAKTLRRLRKAKGYTRKEAARKFITDDPNAKKTPLSTYNSWENRVENSKNRRRPPRDAFLRMVKEFADILTPQEAQQWGEMIEYKLTRQELKTFFPEASIEYQRLYTLDEDEQSTTFPGLTLQRFKEYLLRQYGYFLLPGGIGETKKVSFNEWSFIPQLYHPANDEHENLEKLLRQPNQKICIYGPPGSGKTIMSRFAIYWLANTVTSDELKEEKSKNESYFPLPVNGSLISSSNESSPFQNIAAHCFRQRFTDFFLNDEYTTLVGWMKAHKSRLKPVIDDWDQTSALDGQSSHAKLLADDLRTYPGYILFSRKPDPRFEFEAVTLYETGVLSDHQVEHFIARWGELFKRNVDGLYAAVQSSAADPLIKRSARSPLGLLSLCNFFSETQRLPHSSFELVTEITDILLDRELRRLKWRDDADQNVVRILRELAWYAYVAPGGKVRKHVYPAIKLREAQSLFSHSEDKTILRRLYGSQFLRIQHSDSAQRRLAFHFEWQRDFYAAEKLLSLGERGRDIEIQVTGRQDWQNVLKIYGQLMSERGDA